MPVISDTNRVLLAAAFAVTAVLLAFGLLDRSERVAAHAALGASPHALAAQSPVPTPAVAEGDAVLAAASAPDATAADDASATAANSAAGGEEEPANGVDGGAVTPPGRACERDNLLVDVARGLSIHPQPGRGARIGMLPARSKYLGAPLRAWVQKVSPDGRYGLVDVPWTWPQRRGWVRLDGLPSTRSAVTVRASLGRRDIRVMRGCRVLLRVPAAIGAEASPSPRGRFFVTDLVEVPSNQPQFGSFAFGLSTVQPNLPRGWSGGNQMAIHGTNSPSSIGSAASAGCLRVSEEALAQLRRHLRPGTPVLIEG